MAYDRIEHPWDLGEGRGGRAGPGYKEKHGGLEKSLEDSRDLSTFIGCVVLVQQVILTSQSC